MKTWPDADGSAITRYLSQLRLRSPISPIYYRQVLRSFQEIVVRRQCSPSQVSRDVLDAWLRERTLCQRCCTVLVSSTASSTFLCTRD